MPRTGPLTERAHPCGCPGARPRHTEAARAAPGTRPDVHPQRPGVGSDPETDPGVAERELEQTFLRAVDEGRRRLSRRTLPLLATGVLAGVDVGTGVLALLVVGHETESVLLAGLAFSIGFIALSLPRSELFTEDFLVPVTTVLARQARLRMLLRLWSGTLLANLAGGWAFTWLIMKGYPQLADRRSRPVCSTSTWDSACAPSAWP